MSAPHQPDHRSQRPDNARTPSDASAEHWWEKQQNPRGTLIAYSMTILGFALLFLFLITAINNPPFYNGLLLLCSCALVFFGSIGLLFDLADWMAKRFIRSRRFCGCCVSYKPLPDDYSTGECLAAHSKGNVERNHLCPYFHYSERAMVRDRLWQNRYTVERIRSIQSDHKPTDNDD